jgi:hypothetical protein
MSSEIAEVVEARGAMRVLMQNPPIEVLREAASAATALKDVISKKPKPVIMNGEQYLEFEDWQTLGRFYGITAKEDGDPAFVEFGDVRGFKASAVALDRDGNEISRATAYCLSDEEKWGERTKYAYAYCLQDGGHSVEDPGPGNIVWEDNPNKPGKKRPKKERIQVGMERVPLFQLASMAQTRANSKVLRNVLSWVAVLAGYRPTPAEEIEAKADAGDDSPARPGPQQPRPQQRPQQAPPKAAAPPPNQEVEGEYVGDAAEPEPLTQKTRDGILAGLQALKSNWARARQWVAQIVGRPIGADDGPETLTEPEAVEVLAVIEGEVRERHAKAGSAA